MFKEICSVDPKDTSIERTFYFRLAIGEELKSIYVRKNAYEFITEKLEKFIPIFKLSRSYKINRLNLNYDFLVKPKFNNGFVPLYDEVNKLGFKDQCYYCNFLNFFLFLKIF